MGRREGPQTSPRHQCRRRPHRGAGLVADVVGSKGQIGFDTSRPRGTPRKLLDVSRPSANRANARASARRLRGIVLTQRKTYFAPGFDFTRLFRSS
jgi:hypothetical protein